MSRTILLGLLLVLTALAIGLPTSQSQPPPLPGFGAQPGRFTVVKVTDAGAVYLIDTTTGDLFKATLEDAKPYSERPKVNDRFGPPPLPKDAPFPGKDANPK